MFDLRTRFDLCIFFAAPLPFVAPARLTPPATEAATVSASAPPAEDDPEPRPAVAALLRHVFSENEKESEAGRTGDTPTLVFGVPASDEPGFREELLLPTYEALRRAFPDHWIESRELDRFDLILAVVKHEVEIYVVLSGVSVYFTHGAGSSWPAMPVTEASKELVELVNRAAKAAGYDATWVDAGGGSDANRIAEAGVPVVDGVAPAGAGFHSEREYVEVKTIETRVATLSNVLSHL